MGRSLKSLFDGITVHNDLPLFQNIVYDSFIDKRRLYPLREGLTNPKNKKQVPVCVIFSIFGLISCCQGCYQEL